MSWERGHLSRGCSNQTAPVLTPSGENQSHEQVNPHVEDAEHLEDKVMYDEFRNDLMPISGSLVEHMNLRSWKWLRNVLLGDIPIGLPPQSEIELQFEHALGTRCIVNSPPLIQYKEEPPDFVSNTLISICPNSNIAGLILIVDVVFPARLGVVSSGLDMCLLPRKLDLGFRAVPLVFVHYSTLLSALMLASRLYCFAGANREFRDDQWVKEKPPDVGHELSFVGTSGRSRSETRHSVSYTLTFDLSNFVNSGLELIAYDREPDRLGVAHARLDWSCLIVGLDPRFRQGIWNCLCFDALLDNLMLATRSCFIAGTSRVDRIDQWVKEKPPDSSILLLGDGAGDDHTNGSKLGGKVATTLDFSEIDLVYVAAGNVLVLRTKPREEGGDDETLDQQLVPEHVAEELGARRIGGTDSVGCLGVLQGISHLLRRVFGHSAMEGKNMAPSLHW